MWTHLVCVTLWAFTTFYIYATNFWFTITIFPLRVQILSQILNSITHYRSKVIILFFTILSNRELNGLVCNITRVVNNLVILIYGNWNWIILDLLLLNIFLTLCTFSCWSSFNILYFKFRKLVINIIVNILFFVVL